MVMKQALSNVEDFLSRVSGFLFGFDQVGEVAGVGF